MSAIVVYEPIVLNITSGDYSTGNILEISNQFGRDVNIQVYEDDYEVNAEIFADDTDIQITFYEGGIAIQPTGAVKVVIS